MRPLPPVVSDSFRQFPRECVIAAWAELSGGGRRFFSNGTPFAVTAWRACQKQSTSPPSRSGGLVWAAGPEQRRGNSPVVLGPANGRGASNIVDVPSWSSSFRCLRLGTENARDERSRHPDGSEAPASEVKWRVEGFLPISPQLACFILLQQD
jgi:hypothetical protein